MKKHPANQHLPELTVRFGADVTLKIEEIQKYFNLSSSTDPIKRAIVILDFLMQSEKEGKQYVVIDTKKMTATALSDNPMQQQGDINQSNEKTPPENRKIKEKTERFRL